MSLIPFDKKTKIMSKNREGVIPHFSDEEIDAIFDYIRNKIDTSKGKYAKKYRTYFLLTKMLYRTGARIEEILGGEKRTTDKKTRETKIMKFQGIRPKDIDLQKNEMNIVTLKHKTMSYRTLGIHLDLRDSLMQYYLDNNIDQKSTEPLFKIKRGAYHNFLKQMEKELGFHINAHKFRHTVAVKLMQNGVPLNRIQKILGHSSVFTTSVYLDTLEFKDDIMRM